MGRQQGRPPPRDKERTQPKHKGTVWQPGRASDKDAGRQPERAYDENVAQRSFFSIVIMEEEEEEEEKEEKDDNLLLLRTNLHRELHHGLLRDLLRQDLRPISL